MTPSPVEDFTALVLHLLAHVRGDGPEALYDGRYVAWVQRSTDAEHSRDLKTALAMLGALQDRPQWLHAVQIWPELFSSLAHVVAAPAEFGALSAEHVHSDAVRRSLAAAHPKVAACMHRAVKFVAPSFARWHRAVADSPREVDERPWTDAARCMPSLLDQRVECSCSVGSRGRALPSRVIVGMAMPWNELDPYVPAVVALHELSVIDSEGSDYVHAEWGALVALAKRMRSAADALQQAHAGWLSALDLRGLVGAMRASRALDDSTAELLLGDPLGRAQRLQQLG